MRVTPIPGTECPFCGEPWFISERGTVTHRAACDVNAAYNSATFVINAFEMAEFYGLLNPGV